MGRKHNLKRLSENIVYAYGTRKQDEFQQGTAFTKSYILYIIPYYIYYNTGKVFYNAKD